METFGIFIVILWLIALSFVLGVVVYLLFRFWFEIVMTICIGAIFFFILFAAMWAVFL
jgi:hypothetical protein